MPIITDFAMILWLDFYHKRSHEERRTNLNTWSVMFRSNENKIWFVAIVAIVGCFAVTGGNHAGVANATMRKGLYLIYTGVNTEMMVLWQLTSTQTCTLEWGEDTTYSSGSVQTTEFGNDHQHKYIITNLTPGTKYYYRVDDGTYHTGTFYAAPPDTAASTKFLAFGDCRTNTDIFDSVAAQMINTYEADPACQTFTMLTGDWVNSGKTDSDWQEQFFNRSYSNILEMQANLPINGCIGNHETLLSGGDDGNMFLKYWPYPYVDSGWDSYWTPGTHFWSFDYGPMHITCVDQYDSAYGKITDAQLDWIESDLAATNKDWKFIQLHEPGYSADGQGGHADNTQVQAEIQPLCEMYGVKIVFGGHNHYYARCERNGITHLTLGGSGAWLDTPDPDYSPYIVSTAKKNNFAKFAISGTNIDVVVYEPNGTVIESFNLSNVWTSELPFSDGFESGDFETGGWYISDDRYVEVQSAEVYEGTYAAEIERANYLWNPVSTEGSSDIHVKYARKTKSLEGSDALKVEWSVNGSDWYLLESTQDASWTFVDKACGTGADDSRSFRVRFRVEGGAKDYAYVDEVEITGTLIYPVGDFNGSGSVDFEDIAILTDRWLMSCSGPGWCNGCDIDESGRVDFVDFAHLADHWLEDINP